MTQPFGFSLKRTGSALACEANSLAGVWVRLESAWGGS